MCICNFPLPQWQHLSLGKGASYVTPMISKRSPVLLLMKFEPSMLTYSTADAKEANSVAAVAKEACAFIVW